MLPLIGGAISLITTTVNAVGIGATAGMGYGLGRKYGRKICEFADNMEGKITNMMQHSVE
jgi:hypothetical protein|tara:strand:+ start:251 stop:430 length:180 start_codon:yes stop_codon:yes gene_type:complete